MQRRKFGREFKIEAVRLIRERGVSVAQAARDLSRMLYPDITFADLPSEAAADRDRPCR